MDNINIIKQIMESEYKAHKIVDEAKEKMQQSENNIEKEIQRIKNEIFSSARQKADAIKAEKMEQAKTQVEEIKLRTGEEVASLRKKLEENRSKWVEELVERILKT